MGLAAGLKENGMEGNDKGGLFDWRHNGGLGWFGGLLTW